MGELSQPAIKINFGCGLRKIDEFLNIDNRPEVNPDLVVDITEKLPWEDDSIDVIRAHDILEHIPIGKVVPLIEEVCRVLKAGGIFEVFVPSTDGRGAFQDPNHVSFWNRNSFMYYTVDHCRELYGIKAKFTLNSLQDIVTDEPNRVIHTFAVLVKA